MTDTHDTNLPEKPVELEEEKKAAEVSEPATTETPAEEIVSEKPVEPVQKLTKEEILAKLKEVVADVENVAKPEIDGLKQSFYKLHNAEQDAARKLFIENGGAAENFVPQTDCVEEEFKNIMSVIKEKRSALTAELEKQKEMNLQVKLSIIEELKELVRRAHELGLGVIMDLVHAHYVKNLNEGINELDGTDHHYSLPGKAGYQPYWDSMLFDYGKDEVQHFLLSNVKYWLDEFHFDGYRFDGVTSMIYHHHGYVDFDCRERFFDAGVNGDALTYLTLANRLVHDFRAGDVTIAEDVSGMPGMCIPDTDGGIGFDYRLGMAIPDFWIKQLKEVPDEEWNIWEMWNVMTDRLPEVKTVAYAESHDQALVGDKTLAFRLMDKEMYFNMDRASQSVVIDRGMALHKMIRLMTISTGGQAYLNFMGNEFGHPEWIDFPREGNGWSYAHARRQWSLAGNGFLRYAWLGDFDKAMIKLVKRYKVLADGYAWNLVMDECNKTMAFAHGDLLFVFNWHPSASIPDYELPVQAPGKYVPLLSTDERRFGGQERQAMDGEHFSFPAQDGDNTERPHIRIYNTSRTATVYLRTDGRQPSAVTGE